jgi:arylsulfatase A-like enzyme
MNVLSVTVDCLRYDRVGCISGRDDLTPNIDSFSRDGIEGLYDEVLRVPLTIRWSAQKTVARVDGQVELTTIVPTVLDLLGLPIPEQIVGRSAVPWLTGDASATEPINPEAMASGGVSEQWAAVGVRTQEWKCILHRSGDQQQIKSRLYHLTTDPVELEECGQRYPDVLAQMKQCAEDHIQRLLEKLVPGQGVEEDLPEEVVARLQALDYMD